MTSSTLPRVALGACGVLVLGATALAQTPPPPAAAPPFPPTATITTPGYPGVGPADFKLRVVNLPNGKVHLLPATLETTQWGWFDNAQPPVLTIDSGDTVVLETMMHSHNQVVPGRTIEEIKKLRTDNPGRGPHTLTGPIFVKGAEPGDMLKVKINKIVPRAYATNFNVPGMFGEFPKEYPDGQVKYLYLDMDRKARNSCRASTFRCDPSRAPSASRARNRAATAACRPASTPATWTSAISSRAPRSTCPCTCRARCCGPATRTPRRATAR